MVTAFMKQNVLPPSVITEYCLFFRSAQFTQSILYRIIKYESWITSANSCLPHCTKVKQQSYCKTRITVTLCSSYFAVMYQEGISNDTAI
jgi:hypothetical protein